MALGHLLSCHLTARVCLSKWLLTHSSVPLCLICVPLPRGAPHRACHLRSIAASVPEHGLGSTLCSELGGGVGGTSLSPSCVSWPLCILPMHAQDGKEREREVCQEILFIKIHAATPHFNNKKHPEELFLCSDKNWEKSGNSLPFVEF